MTNTKGLFLLKVIKQRINSLNYYEAFAFLKTYTIDIRNFLMCLMCLVYPLFVFPHFINSIVIPRYFMLIVISIVSLLVLLKCKIDLKKKYLIPLAIFLVCGVVSSACALDKNTAWLGLAKLVAFSAKNGIKPIFLVSNAYYYTGFLTYIMCTVLFLISTIVPNPKHLLKYLILSTCMVSIIALLQYIGIDIVSWTEIAIPISGTLGNPNFLGTLMVFVLPGSIMLYFISKKHFWLFCSGLIFGGLVISNTRGAWLTFIIVFFIIIIYVINSNVNSKKQKIISVCCTFSIVLCILLPLKDGMLIKRGFSINDEIKHSLQLKDEGGSYRIYIWKEVAKIIRDNWVFGVGPDNLIYKKIVLPNDAVTAKAHSNILEIAVTMGIPALLSYLAFVALIFLRYNAGNRCQFTYLLMSFSYMFQGLANIDMVMIYPIFWIVLGLSIACEKQNLLREALREADGARYPTY